MFEPRQVHFKVHVEGFPVGPVVKNLPCHARDASSIPGSGRSHILQIS